MNGNERGGENTPTVVGGGTSTKRKRADSPEGPQHGKHLVSRFRVQSFPSFGYLSPKKTIELPSGKSHISSLTGSSIPHCFTISPHNLSPEHEDLSKWEVLYFVFSIFDSLAFTSSPHNLLPPSNRRISPTKTDAICLVLNPREFLVSPAFTPPLLARPAYRTFPGQEFYGLF